MPDLRPQIEGRGVSVAGTFNPAIFHPSWFGANGLIRPDEAEKAKITVVAPEWASFTLRWLNLDATQQRLDVWTDDVASFEPLRDLVAGTLRVVGSIPLEAIGINVYFHYPPVAQGSLEHLAGMDDTDAWEQLKGRRLDELRVTSARPDEYHGGVAIDVQPSHQVENGVFIGIYEYYDLERTPRRDHEMQAQIILGEELSRVEARCIERAEMIMKRITEQQGPQGKADDDR